MTYHHPVNISTAHLNAVVLPSGSKCPSEGMTSHTVCASGEYQTGNGQTDCLDCPAGNECSDPTSSPVSCDAGTYSPDKSTNCTQCSSGRTSGMHTCCWCRV